MKATKHGDFLIQLAKWGMVNAYLVREEDGFTLIDAAIANTGQAIIDAAASFGLPIKRIVLTHAHTDHVGALEELAKGLPEAEILLTTRTAQFLSGDIKTTGDEPQAKIRGGFTPMAITPTRQIMPGDMVGSLTVIAAPGHTPDHLAYFDSRDKSLIAGDAFQTLGGTAVAGNMRLLFPFPAFATWHKPTALKSAQTLAALKPSRLAVGHGRVLNQPMAEIDAAIKRASK